MRARPVVGSVMRDRILSSVLLPAPLRPMMPTTSPRLTSNETSFSAQIVCLETFAPCPRATARSLRSEFPAVRTSVSRSVL